MVVADILAPERIVVPIEYPDGSTPGRQCGDQMGFRARATSSFSAS
jgi:hypothetical protein